jgi:hypothetical protein
MSSNRQALGGAAPSTALRAVPFPHFVGEDEAGGSGAFLPRDAGEGDHAKHGGGGAPHNLTPPVGSYYVDRKAGRRR